jgi:hypothetical protein
MEKFPIHFCLVYNSSLFNEFLCKLGFLTYCLQNTNTYFQIVVHKEYFAPVVVTVYSLNLLV